MLVDTTAEREFTPDFLWLSSALEMLRANARNFSIWHGGYNHWKQCYQYNGGKVMQYMCVKE